MAFPKPTPPPYSIREWQKKPFAERLKMVCQTWALQGYGAPKAIYIVYLLKIALYTGLWCLFCSFSPGLGDPRSIASWWSAPVAFQKAVLWSMAFEGLGLGCGSGPLTGRYYPPMGGVLYFVRPGTLKMPLFPGLPLIGGDKRTIVDAALYVLHYVLLGRVLIAPAVTPELALAPLVTLGLLGVLDKTFFLASRAEHYGTALVCFLFPADFIAGSKILWVSIWLWAATSKLNHHFPSVVAVMQSNSPMTGVGSFRKRLFRRFPDDLRPSGLAQWMAHLGTVVEYSFPLVLLFSRGGTATTVALVTMLVFHIFITSSIPMGVPLEWNVMMVYGAFFLFGAQASVDVLHIGSPVLLALLAIPCFVVPLLGNLFPSKISFLCAMRYYAGNWPYSIWLFRGDSVKKLNRLVRSAPLVKDQLLKFYDEETTAGLLSMLMAFRTMHLQGRALQLLVPRAVDDIDAYEWYDGEIVAGVAIGYNFGDGHLHDLQLLRAVQRQCHFEEGELRCIFVEAQPMGRRGFAWTIADAATGVRETGEIEVRKLLELQPYPSTGAAARAA